MLPFFFLLCCSKKKILCFILFSSLNAETGERRDTQAAIGIKGLPFFSLEKRRRLKNTSIKNQTFFRWRFLIDLIQRWLPCPAVWQAEDVNLSTKLCLHTTSSRSIQASCNVKITSAKRIIYISIYYGETGRRVSPSIIMHALGMVYLDPVRITQN